MNERDQRGIAVRARRERARAAYHAERRMVLMNARREELGRLLEIATAQSRGGFVLIRLGMGLRRVRGEVEKRRERRWKVNVRHEDGEEYTTSGQDLGGALYRAAYRLIHGTYPHDDEVPRQAT